jgi:predicted esterase
MIKKIGCILFFFLLMNGIDAQTGKTIRFATTHAMFPDSLRKNGHTYNGKVFDAETHYSDSSVLVYVPPGFSAKEKINLVFWFHGWGNNIDTACKQFQLTEQFEASGRNAVFVFPEGPKNASDSYGGKLEQPEVFQQLVKDVAGQLQENKFIKKKKFQLDQYDISLAGHSGAYRVISRIINRTPVNEVILFDAMYGGNDAYIEWLSVPEHRFINIYTKDGGTFDNSLLIAKTLTDSLHVPLVSLKEEEVSENTLRSNNKIFMFSSKGHNEVITNNRNWERFLRKEK